MKGRHRGHYEVKVWDPRKLPLVIPSWIEVVQGGRTLFWSPQMLPKLEEYIERILLWCSSYSSCSSSTCINICGFLKMVRPLLEMNMSIQGREVPNGWPLGLGIMNLRLRTPESVQAAASARESGSFHAPSSSFSSFSSSNLDTESTSSFFQDNSVSLGRLIGIRPRDRGSLYFPNTLHIPERRSQHPEVPPEVHETDTSHGICVPHLLNIIVKISRSKSHSKQ